MQVTDTTQEIGTMYGHRGIIFTFEMIDGTRRTVTLDFYGNGSAFNGATYARCETAALRAVITAGLETKPNWTHHIFS